MPTGTDIPEANASKLSAFARSPMTSAVLIAAIALFAFTLSSALPALQRLVDREVVPNDSILMTNNILSVALIFICWRRLRDLGQEATKIAAVEERSRELSLKDPLTGLLNRRALVEEIEALFESARRRQKAIAMIVIDIDHFKNVNDVHGHVIGDALLKHVANELTKLVPPGSLVARLGGDEFACIIMFDPSAPDTITQIAERIVARMAHPTSLSEVHIHVSVSVGLAQTAVDCDKIDSLMRRADIAMYSAKTQGRNRCAWFDVSMEQALRTRNDVELGLRRGIPRQEFVPYFEPQVELTTGRLIGFEMLARWNHPDGRLIGPEVFIGIAEETGLIGDLSMSLMRQAFEGARLWDPSVTISVNISPVQLRDPWLAQKIVKLLVETGYASNRLEVEITESSLFENLSLAQSIIGSLKNQGIKLALDDFGTGYSSLAHLRALPFDRIKIDKSFVLSILNNADSAAIVNAIARLGDSLNLPVTAEGIEDVDIETRLRQLGCQKGQGWYHGRPMTYEKACALLATKGLLLQTPPQGLPTLAPAELEQALPQRRVA